MQARLKALHSADVDDMRTWVPEDPYSFGLGVQAFVGPSNGPGEESFDFMVVGPGWFDANPGEKRFHFVRHFLVLQRWDYELLSRALSDLCLKTEGKNWREVAEQLARYGHWEFEDYRESR